MMLRAGTSRSVKPFWKIIGIPLESDWKPLEWIGNLARNPTPFHARGTSELLDLKSSAVLEVHQPLIDEKMTANPEKPPHYCQDSGLLKEKSATTHNLVSCEMEINRVEQMRTRLPPHQRQHSLSNCGRDRTLSRNPRRDSGECLRRRARLS